METVSFSPTQARKLALLSQQVLGLPRTGKALDSTFNAISHLGYIQIDTISVIQRAHHHTLWNRNPRYGTDHLNKLLEQKKVFEYWSHAAAYLPMEDYRFSLPNKESIARGRQLWFDCDPAVKQGVLQRIRAEGPLQSRDFENHGKTKLPMWEWKPAKYALEQLFMEGRLMVARRENFQKVYDLAERVLPDGLDVSMPTKEEFARKLILQYLDAHGFGDAAEIAYLRKGVKKTVQHCLDSMAEDNELVRVSIQGHPGFTRVSSLDLLDRRLPLSRLRILSPFDNLVIQRKRIKRLFGFDYQVECYVPADKRKYGYFCLPVLWNAKFVARLDCKADRKTGTLRIRNLVLEPGLRQKEAFARALARELENFMGFNGCSVLGVERVSDSSLKKFLVSKFS